MELYIIRHAQSTNNALASQEQRVEDPALTDLGQRQAERLADHLARGCQPLFGAAPEGVRAEGHLRGYGLTHLYCSPMLRSLQTADYLARALDLKPQVWIEVHEQGGIFLEEGAPGARLILGKPGMTRPEILGRFPNFTLPEAITERGWWNRGFEEWAACHARAAEVAEELRARAASGAGQRVAIVSHGGFIDALLKALLHSRTPQGSNGHSGPPPGDPGIFFLHYNAAIDFIAIREDGHVRVVYLNRIEHLPPDLTSY